ncbi:MAG: hypothetical protein DDT22_00901 [candidate division WS2 bacterium]|nr:hypothetical protein [Candidatus Lithacetigena glycinireducens]
MFKFDLTDIIAILIVIACFGLIYLGKNSFVQMVLATVVGYYFGKKRGEVIGGKR